ncbi:retrovirus-related pol polyprotein from transposon TNT 1-94 [Tanacetum coccineum]|uniref:Retrovirus-related pol polyprotein from transposon TNT 1-94 n=1 Tax=Tanacetum coccineum TaxID=301880 RepID=A0ABQ4Z379_9ASTR
MKKKFEMSMIGDLTYFLGLKIKQDDKEISICQEQYTRNLLKKYEISDSFSVKTPMIPPNNLGPDLASKPSNPKESYLIAVKRILMYLKGTPTLGLYYPKCSGFDLKGYSDSDYAGCNIDRKSTSAEAEYVFAAGCYASILWIKSQLSDYDIHYKMVHIFCDNTSTIATSNNPVLHSRTKNIDISGVPKPPQGVLVHCHCLSHPNPPTDDSEVRPLKEYLITFSVMNSKKPLTLTFKTFTESTRLDYAKGKYVSNPFTKEVKAELAKIFLGGNCSSTEQVNSIQQFFAYCLFTRTKIDIGEIIYIDLITRLTNKSRQKYVSYVRFVSCALEVLLGSNYTQDESFGSSPTILSNSNFSKDSSKVTPIELTAFIVAVNNHDKSTNPLPFTIKSQRLSGKQQPINTGLPSMVFDEGTVKTMSLPEGPRRDKDLEGLKPPADMEPLTNPVVDPSGTNAKYQVDQTQSARLRITEDQWAHHEEATFSYADLRAYIDEYTERADLLKALNGVTKTLKVVQEAVKDDLALNRKVIEATEAYTKNSTSYCYQSGSTLSRMGQVINFHVGPSLTAIETPSQSSGRKRKHMELEPEIRVPGLECNRSLPQGVPFMNNIVIEEPECRIFFTDVFGD